MAEGVVNWNRKAWVLWVGSVRMTGLLAYISNARRDAQVTQTHTNNYGIFKKESEDLIH